MAGSGIEHRQVDTIIEKLLRQIKPEALSFDQQLDVINALALIGSPTKSAVNVMRKMLTGLDRLVFERLDNELTYTQFDKIREAHLSMKSQGKWPLLKNKKLSAALETDHMRELKYLEN